MAVKSLTITEDAYNILKRLKHGNESFSEAIVRFGEEKMFNVNKYFGILKMSPVETKDMLENLKRRKREFTEEAKKRQERFQKLRGSHGSS